MIRVRFAPSPTGYLHIGGARTALYNYLFAKKNNGKFILRIEDTDAERSTEESLNTILDCMHWLGLDWDEGPGAEGGYGPYFQTKRLSIYKEYADKLLKEGKAYKCFCTKEELDAERKKAEIEKRAFKYGGRCRNLTSDDISKNEAEGKKYTIRIKIDSSGETVINDMIRGEVKFQNSVLDDLIIIRADGMPIYNFTVAIDDALMKITHVIRGEDHLSNTPKQVQIYRALGFELPHFAHIPLILGPDKSKLSKRHGETSVGQYRKNGYMKEALLNYLALLGWSPESGEDVMSMQQLTEKFGLERVHKAGAMFDGKKLMWMNGVYIRNTGADELTKLCIPYLKDAGLITDDDIKNKYDYIKKVIMLQQEKMRTLAESAELSGYFFKKEISLDEKARKNIDKAENRVKILEIFKNVVETAGVDKTIVEEKLKAEMEAAAIEPKIYMHLIRAVVSGTTIGPGLFDIIETLGKDTVLARVGRFL